MVFADVEGSSDGVVGLVSVEVWLVVEGVEGVV